MNNEVPDTWHDHPGDEATEGGRGGREKGEEEKKVIHDQSVSLGAGWLGEERRRRNTQDIGDPGEFKSWLMKHNLEIWEVAYARVGEKAWGKRKAYQR